MNPAVTIAFQSPVSNLLHFAHTVQGAKYATVEQPTKIPFSDCQYGLAVFLHGLAVMANTEEA